MLFAQNNQLGTFKKIMTLGTDLRPIKSVSLGVVPGIGGFLSSPDACNEQPEGSRMEKP